MTLSSNLLLVPCCAIGLALPQDVSESRVLAFLWREATVTADAWRVRVALLSDPTPDTTSPLVQALLRAGVPLAPLSAQPAGDTLILRVTRPVFFTDSLWRVGVEFLVCTAGRILGDRTYQMLSCDDTTCVRPRYHIPYPRERLELGPCGGPG